MVMRYVAQTVRKPTLFACMLDVLYSADIRLHAGPRLAPLIGRETVSLLRLETDPASHSIVGTTISMTATLLAEAFGGSVSKIPVSITIADHNDPFCTPVIETTTPLAQAA